MFVKIKFDIILGKLIILIVLVELIVGVILVFIFCWIIGKEVSLIVVFNVSFFIIVCCWF